MDHPGDRWTGEHDTIDAVCDRIVDVGSTHPVRVAIDGITAAGKTTFADAVGERLRSRGREVVRISMDGFHHPRAVRYRQGRGSADGYYEDAYDFDSVRRLLLEPLGPDGDRRYRPAVIDLASDSPVGSIAGPLDDAAVLVVDGSFLQKPEVRAQWDVVVFLRASFEAAERRGVARDTELLGGADSARTAFRERYHAAQRRYLAEVRPESIADLVVDVEDPATATLVR